MKWVLGVSIIAVVMGWAATATIPAATVSIDEAALKFLPPETQGVAFIDVAALRDAPLFRDAIQNRSGLGYPGDIAEFFSATGLDPHRDIDKVTIAKTGVRDGFAVVQARIDEFKVEQFFKDKGKQPEAYLGRNLYRNGNTAFVFLDNVVIVGQLNSVKKALDQMQLPGSLPLRSDLLAAIQSLEAGSQVWAVGDVSFNDLRSVGLRGPAPAVELLKSLKSGTYQLRVDTDVHARATGNFSDAESAANVGNLARGALAVAKVQVAKQQPDALQLLDGIEISNNGTTLMVRVEESGDLLKKLKDFYRPAIEKTLR